MSLAGSYLSDGPAFFIATESTAAVVPSMTLDTLPAIKIGAQEGSPAFWRLQSEFGAESLVGYPTLRDALNGVRVGEVRVAAGDALVAGYIIRDMPTVHFAGQLEPAVPLGVAVALDNVAWATPCATRWTRSRRTACSMPSGRSGSARCPSSSSRRARTRVRPRRPAPLPSCGEHVLHRIDRSAFVLGRAFCIHKRLH